MRAQLSRDRVSRSDSDYDLDQLERRIRGAIANGSLSGENSRCWLDVLARARQMEARMNAAVAAGRLTQEQGMARLQAGLRGLLALCTTPDSSSTRPSG